MKRNNLAKKGLVFWILILFVVYSITQMTNSAELFFGNSKSFNVEPITEIRNIMLTGYWDPTGQMIAPFSNDTYLNPGGWKGANWSGLGYNIYSFFPTPGVYNGTFEVDYQDTWEDFWSITSEIHPVAIISFGAGGGPWEIEYNARNLYIWMPDNEPPYQPTPCPPDRSMPPVYVRHSTLPVRAIADAVNDQTSVEAWIDWNGNPGRYLCEYMAYLGMWYQAIHNTTDDPYRCWSAGFIHVKSSIALEDAMEASNVTIREVIKYLLNVNCPPNAPTITGETNGKFGESYDYAFVSTDPDDNDVRYYINWGDGEVEEWIGSYPSGEGVIVNHTWEKRGTYTISAKSKDVHDAISDWGTLDVTMPVNQQTSDSLFLRFLDRFPNTFPILRHILKL